MLLDVVGEDAVRTAYRTLTAGRGATTLPDGVLVQELIGSGIEMIVGVDNTSGFGPVVMLGFGGSRVEQLRDVALELAPMSVTDASTMRERLRLAPLLEGVHDGKSYDVAGLTEFLVRLSEWAHGHQALITELDINPLIVSEHGVTIVDSVLVRPPVVEVAVGV